MCGLQAHSYVGPAPCLCDSCLPCHVMCPVILWQLWPLMPLLLHFHVSVSSQHEVPGSKLRYIHKTFLCLLLGA